jgi:hypothetical protein
LKAINEILVEGGSFIQLIKEGFLSQRSFPPNRLLKNARLQRCPPPSPCQARSRLIAAHAVGNGLKPFPTKDFGRPRKRDFEDSTCICLPARSPALRDEGRGIFEHPEK